MRRAKYWLGVVGLLIGYIVCIPIAATRNRDGRWLLLMFTSMFLGFVNQALILTFLWNWFIAPLGATNISLIHALGIWLMISLSKSSLSYAQHQSQNNFEQLKSLVKDLTNKPLHEKTLKELSIDMLWQQFFIPWCVFLLPGFLFQFFI